MKPKLAIISSYEDLCGNASYTRALETNLGELFDVTVFNLITNPALRQSKTALNDNINAICKALQDYDFVNIQFEAGLFGTDENEIIARVKKLINASQYLLMTFHRVDTESQESTALRRLASYMLRFKFLNRTNKLPFSRKNKSYTQRVTEILSSRPASKPYKVIVHRHIDVNVLETTYKLPKDNIVCFPLVYFSKSNVQMLTSKLDTQSWRIKRGIAEDIKLIGVFGFFGLYKGFNTAIQALQCLPKQYRLAIIGGQHPMNIKPMKIDTAIVALQNSLIDPNDETFSPDQKLDLIERVSFQGSQPNDEDMTQAMLAVDFVVLPYLEVGQSASGIASMSLELGKKTILSRTLAFIALEKFYPKCFESFDIGNALELKQKIEYYDESTIGNRKATMAKYSAETLAQEYFAIYSSMKQL